MVFLRPYPFRQVVQNPPTPFNGDIPNGVRGKQITVRGVVSPSPQQFRIDLLNAQGHIALHINPRFNVRQIVRNTERGGWGPEERHGPFPFNPSEQFEVQIQVEDGHYSVSINRQHAFDYNHRVPLQEVSRISVQGDVQVQDITYFGGEVYPVSEVYNVPVPSALPLVGGLHDGTTIQVVGNIPHSAGRFQINLQSSPGAEPNDIDLHFNPRWNDPYSPQPVLVRTHRRGGAWGNEDRSQVGFPFQKGAQFELVFKLEGNHWKVAANGEHFVNFPYNGIPVDHIGFVGDVNIEFVKQFP